MGRFPTKARLFWPLLAVFLVLDAWTKRLALAHLAYGEPVPVVGDLFRLTLSFNTGAAMGLVSGAWVPTVLGWLAVALSVAMWVWYRGLPDDARLLPVTLALIVAGALGNGVERIFSDRGVVDFVDVGLGDLRFYIFNVADTWITCGAILMIAWEWRESRRKHAAETSDPAPDAPTPAPSGGE